MKRLLVSISFVLIVILLGIGIAYIIINYNNTKLGTVKYYINYKMTGVVDQTESYELKMDARRRFNLDVNTFSSQNYKGILTKDELEKVTNIFDLLKEKYDLITPNNYKFYYDINNSIEYITELQKLVISFQEISKDNEKYNDKITYREHGILLLVEILENLKKQNTDN